MEMAWIEVSTCPVVHVMCLQPQSVPAQGGVLYSLPVPTTRPAWIQAKNGHTMDVSECLTNQFRDVIVRL